MASRMGAVLVIGADIDTAAGSGLDGPYAFE
jgi:hypothetical protein